MFYHQGGRSGSYLWALAIKKQSRRPYSNQKRKSAGNRVPFLAHPVFAGWIMWGEASALAHIARHSVGSLGAHRGRIDAANLSGEFACVSVALKLFWALADKSSVQRTAMIAGLSLAMGGATLAGIGEWSTYRVDVDGVGPDSSTSSLLRRQLQSQPWSRCPGSAARASRHQ